MASGFLLAGMLFDSAGNRMTPSHSRKRGVRYRYYVSQAILQNCRSEAGVVSRVPASEVETLIWKAVAVRTTDPMATPSCEIVAANVQRVIILAKTIDVAFNPIAEVENPAAGPCQAPETVSIPWSPKPAVAAKGPIEPAPSVGPATNPKTRDAILAAISKARDWLEEILAGGCTTDIANREGKGERQIKLLLPLAFMPPATVRGLLDGSVAYPSVTETARAVPLIWYKRP